MKKHSKEDCVYREFSLEDGITKKGSLDWGKNASDGTKKNCEQPIILKDKYKINWKNYLNLDDSNTGNFIFLVNKVKGK